MFRRNSLMTRILSAVLSVGMVWSMSPTSVLAENAISQNASAAQTESTQAQSETTKQQEKTPATIVLDANGGTGTMDDVQIADSSSFDQKLAQNVYKRDGYLFMGWSTTANNKDAKNAAGRVVTPAIAVPDAADIANWKFLWDANGDGTADPATETFDLSSCVKDGTLTLYAQWARFTTTVHFDGNGATSGTMDDEAMPQDTDTALTSNAFARDGYKFTGWSTTKDNQSIKDDPATAADESFLATFLGDQVHFLKNVASYDSDGDGTAESFDMNYAAAADPKNAANSTITLYAQWEKLPEQNVSENADASQDTSSETSDDSEQKSDESQSASDDQNAASDTGSDSAADNQNAETEAADSSESKEESAADESADSSDEPGLVAESDEDHLKNAAPVETTADNAQADVRDADHGGADNLSVKVQDTSAATSFVQSLNMLFAAPAKESAEAPADNPSQDGESIKELSVKWETPGKVSADDSALTIFTPSDNSKQTAKASVYISLDSNKSYKAGSVRLVIPGHIFKKRDGSKTGNLVLPLVENPGTKTEFNWAYDAENDVYTLTSTRDISGRSEIKIEMGFENLTPSTLVDMQASSDFVAKAYVTNSKGNLLTKTSNTIKAAFDTQETLKTAEIMPNGQIPWETKVPASQIPEDKRIAGVDQYLVVTYYTYAYHTGNTAYTLGWDKANEDFGAYDANGAKVADGVVIDGGSGTDTKNDWSWDGNTGWHYMKVAYDFSKFSVDTDYTLRAGAKWTLTETDNAGQIHVLPATTSVKFAWHNPVAVPPGGHYAHMNWGDDNNDSFMMHLSMNGYQYDYSNRTFSHAELLRGYYGIYRTALNDLAEGSDATVRYQKYLRGYMLPDQLVRGGDNTKKASFTNPVRMVLEDGDYSIAENAGDPQYQGLTAGTDYDIASVLVCKPTHVYKATEVDASNLQSKDFLYETGTSEPYYYSPGSKVQGGTYGVAYEKTDDLDYYPKSVVEAEINGQWQIVDTVDWKTATSDKVEVKLPAGTQRWRVTVASDSIAKEGEQAAAVDTQFVCPTVVLHPTDKVKSLAATAINDMTTPECLFQSADSFNAYNSANAVVWNANENGADHLFGYNSNIMAMPSAPKNPSDHSKDGWDNGKTKYSVTFSGKVQEQSSVLDKDTWEEAAKAGKIQTEKLGTWYDLLPKGAVADLSTIQLRDGDQVTDAYTIENYKGSGRTLLVVKAQLAAEPVYQDRDGVKYVEDDPSITFKATYSISSYLDYGQNLHNVVVFESGNETLGNVEHYIGQPDDPTKASADDVTVTKDITDGEKDILKDLDPSTDKAAFTYAGESVNIGAYTITDYGFDKQVDVNNEYDYGYGTTDGEKDTYLGGFYSYRLSYIAEEGNYQGLVMYDRLEDPRDGVMPSGASSWKGTLLSVDTSMLKSMGIEPVVYYSTTPNLQLATMEGGAVTGTAAAQADLTNNTSIWSATAPSDLSSVTAIAIDCSHKTDGSAFILDAGQTIAATIAMRAPSDASKESSRAYNDAYFSSQTENAGHVEDAAMTYKGHTEVALKPFKLHVTNTWNDDNDRDGLRPAVRKDAEGNETSSGKVVLHLYANGEPAQDANGKEISFTIDPAAASDGYAMSQDADEIIDSLPIADASGNAIHYTATLTNEDGSAIDGYTQSVKYGKDTDGNAELALTQNHTPATTSISGTKTWSGDTEDIRPSAISINLLADGQQSQTRQITENAAGEWIYSFQNLPKYENHGKEIAYTVSETGAEDYAASTTPTGSGYDLQNVYHPYGELAISKNVKDGTEATKAQHQEFVFDLSLTKKDGSEYTDAVSYRRSDGTTGTLEGRTLKLADGESIVLTDLPKDTIWKVTEEDAANYTANSAEMTGVIKSNAECSASFTNVYKSAGDISLQATKTLDGRPIQYGQFTFELRDEHGQLVRTASNDEKGTVSFGALHYTNHDSGTTFTYTISETDPQRPGYSHDSTKYEADVTPTDKGDGTMDVDVRYYRKDGDKRGDEVAKPTFNNTYTASGRVTLTAYKQLKGRDLKAGDFTFDLHAVDVANGIDRVIATAQNDASGRIDFTDKAVAKYMKDNKIGGVHGLSYTQNDLYEEGSNGIWHKKDVKDTTFVYYVTEVAGSDDAVEYSKDMFAWTVALQDDGDSNISETTMNVDANGLISKDSNGNTEVNRDWTAKATTSLPTFVNTLKDGSLSIEKRAEDAPAGDQTPFTFDVDIKDSDGRPLDSDNVTYEITDSPDSSSAGSPAASPAGTNPVSTTLNSLASLLQPTSAYGADLDSDDAVDTHTVTYDANGGMFADGSTQNKVTYSNYHKSVDTKYSHTANIDDNGESHGYFDLNLSTTDVVTIPGATHLTIDVWYSTGWYAWLAIYPAGITPDANNYNQASISGGKLSRGTGYTKDDSWHEQFTVHGDTAQFYFKSERYGRRYYGYYAVVKDGGIFRKSGSYSEPTKENEYFHGWYTDAACTNRVDDPDSLAADTVLYAKFDNYKYEGDWGTCPWGIYPDGTLVIGAGNAGDADSAPWRNSEYRKSIKNVKATGTVVLPENCWNLFEDCSGIESIDCSLFDTSKVTNMGGMFEGCSNLSKLDISSFDTSNVTNMAIMFDGCRSLRSLDLSSFDTSKVTNMNSMFRDCASLQNLDISSFDTSNVDNMNGMFERCSDLKTLDVASFDTSNVTLMDNMFSGCSGLSNLDLSNFDTSNVKEMSSMFSDCSELTKLDLSNFNTSQVEYMSYMFSGCSNLVSLNVSSFDTSKVKVIDDMFSGCSSLVGLNLASFDTSSVDTTYYFMNRMFNSCSSLRWIKFGAGFSFANPYDYTGLPEPKQEGSYTGKWVCVEDPIKVVSSEELCKDGNKPEGTYVWQLNTPVTVTFDSNGGTAGSMSPYIVKYDCISIPQCGFYRVENGLKYDFTGWNTQPDGKGASYQPGDYFDLQGKSWTLYAQWKPDNTAKVTNGRFTVTIKAGQKITITGLPGGATYTVKEHSRAGWVLKSSTGATGRVPALGIASSVFTNRYDPTATSVDISATKTLDGRAPRDGAYSFSMTADTVGAPMPDGATATSATATNVGTLVDFGRVVFTKPGTYIYTLKEAAGTDSTISYDSHTIKARVDVSDPKGTGALTARVIYSRNGTFSNTTKPGTLTVTKAVAGTSDTSKGFTFSVSLMDAKSNPLSGNYGGVSVRDGKGAFTLRAGESKQLSSLPAGTQYKVEETDVPDGYTSSSTGAEGTIAAAGSATAAFTNTYSASATSAYLTAQKTLMGRQLKDKEFTFELKDADGRQVQTATNAADGSIAFEAIPFTSAGEYKYYIDEVKPEDAEAEISYSTEAYEYDVQVTDNGAGELQNAVSIYAVDPSTHERNGDKVDAASFTNAVKTGSVSLTKNVEHSDATGKTFAFDVSLKDSAGKALDGEYTWTSSRKGTGGKAITGTVKNGGKLDLQKDETVTIDGLPVGTKYEFTEEDVAGYTQSARSNLSGTIVADQTAQASATNTYAATGVAQIRARKVVLRSGQETTPAANAFRFSLTEKSGEKSSMYDKPVAVTTTNDGNGNVAFMKLVYTADDAGKTFEYTIAEVVDGQGDAYDFDSNSYLAEVTVMDNHDGTLDCQVKYSTDDGKTWTDDVPVFRNNTVTKMPLSGAAGFDGLIAAGGAVLVISALAWIRRRRRNGEA